MMIVKLMGGLGNHMFIYAFARAYSLKSGEKIVFWDSQFGEQKHGNDSTLLELNIDSDTAAFISKDDAFSYDRSFRQLEFRTVCYLVKNMPRKNPKLWKKMLKFLEPVFNKRGYVITNNELVNLDKLKGDIKYAYGYFQNAGYFSSYSDIIRNELRVKANAGLNSFKPADANFKVYSAIIRSESVCVHVRRGDYIGSSVSDNICDAAYFKRGIMYIKEHIQNPIFFVFSDSPDAAHSILKCNDANFVFVNNGNRAHEDLMLMYSCKHFIISNSSFSWWAQYLGNFEKKMVIAPKRWNRNDSERSLYLNNWILL